MAEAPQEKEPLARTSTAPSSWVAEKPKKGPNYYKGLREYNAFISGHELLPMPTVMEAVSTRIIPLLTMEVKNRKFIAISRETMEEALKALNIAAKVLARRPNALWDILLATEEAVEALAGNVLTTKTLRLKTEYMGTRKTRITLHGVLMYISEDHLVAFFSDFHPI